ncbi:phage tail protein [Pseudomonas gingeri]|uniref:Phage tail protein n=1 Tax=Pseudomonas gingeri TaxID=117681 RepID=A0A7Y7WZW1_9PSED|nr:phage tail protein [Pseudomonas gingeri]NWB89443.1 phage tail protein [Pseudomonas gingeri]
MIENAKMSIAAASATTTFTADEVIVETALGGSAYQLPNFSKTINLATTGVGGMDTGTAPVSGFVSIYAIYIPTTGASGLLACAQAISNGGVYSGANMPAGYTALALVSAWPTNSGGQLIAGFQVDRGILIAPVTAISAGSASSYISLIIATAVPSAAQTVSGIIVANGSSATTVYVAGSASGIGQKSTDGNTTGTVGPTAPFSGLPLITSQTIYYFQSGGTIGVNITGYTF